MDKKVLIGVLMATMFVMVSFVPAVNNMNKLTIPVVSSVIVGHYYNWANEIADNIGIDNWARE